MTERAWAPTQLRRVWLQGMPAPCLIAVDPTEWDGSGLIFVRARLLDNDLLGETEIWINRAHLMIYSQTEEERQ